MITIKDVAQASGVSIASVSRVLNQKEDVGDEVRAVVLAACEKLGYRRNAMAASLPRKKGREGKSGYRNCCLGLIVTVQDRESFLSDHFQQRYLAGVQRGISEKSLHMMLDVVEGEIRQREIPAMIAESRVDGVILKSASGVGFPTKWVEELSLQIPVVLLGAEIGGKVPSVVPHDQGDSLRALQYLYDLGHRQIGFLSVQDTHLPRNFSHGQRLHAYHDFFQIQGLRLEPSWVQVPERDWATQSLASVVAIAFTHWWEMGEKRPTAIICANDVYALQLLQESSKRGIRVPDDLSVIGFMDVQGAKESDPPLTTIRLPGEEMGRVAVEVLCRHIEKRDAIVEMVSVNGIFVERLSCRSLG